MTDNFIYIYGNIIVEPPADFKFSLKNNKYETIIDWTTPISEDNKNKFKYRYLKFKQENGWPLLKKEQIFIDKFYIQQEEIVKKLKNL